MTGTPQNANAYLRTKVMTASPAQLRLMLFDGSIKFCRQARQAVAQKQFEDLYNSLTRAQKIVLELATSLNHETDPDLCDKLASLYNYIYLRLVDANLERDETAIDECIRLLEYERDTWAMLLKKAEEGEGGDAAGVNAGGAGVAAGGAAAAEAARNPIGNIGPGVSGGGVGGYGKASGDGVVRESFSAQG